MKEVNILEGKFEILLDVSKTGNNKISLVQLENTKLQNCVKSFQNLEFTYTVTECRQPNLKVEPFIAQDTYCLNQSGITLMQRT
jgi:hypothetical protein